MQEDEFLVDVGVDVLDLELGVKGWVDGELGTGGEGVLVALGEDLVKVEEGDGFVGGVLRGAFLGEAFGGEDARVGEGRGPGREVDVVLDVRGDEVGYWEGELVEVCTDGWG